jgi:pyruvate/2-oxoglutarate dehydrogenase complex dihydrolipoamide acyltransferase (E2) component
MPFWYFFTIPKLPSEVAHQSNQVEVREYLATEGKTIEPGTPIVLIENYWALMRLKANGNGILKKTFFTPGTSVKVGDQSPSSVVMENRFPMDRAIPSLRSSK